MRWMRSMKCISAWAATVPRQFEIMLAGADAAAASSTASSWQTALQDSKQQWGEQLPTVARLHDALSVSDEQGAVLMQASVDKAWLKDAARLPQELMGLIFSGTGVSMTPSGNAAATPEERIDENPAQFLASISADALPAYQAEPPFLPEADTVSGPFGIRRARSS